ncbi:MAG: UDP-glucose 4-epimerase GalE [Polyangiaceae bacterium]
MSSGPLRVLVTGGAGYVGSHAAKALRVAGFEPIVLDDLSVGHEWAVRYGPLVRGSIHDLDLVSRLLAEERVGAVMHFAASAYVRESLEVPEKYFRNNVAGSIALLEASLRAGVRAFVLSSSCAVYGIPEIVPIAESSLLEPINPYGESKLMIERMLDWYGRLRGLRWAALRYFNAAGADPDGEIGEVHDPETHILPLLVQAARGERGPIPLFGTALPTPDGTPIRDYVHVTDLADAHVRCLNWLLEGGASRAFNLGTGTGASIRELIGLVAKETGRTPPVVERPASPGDPPILIADSRAAASDLGWTPRCSSLDFIVHTAAKWESMRPR